MAINVITADRICYLDLNSEFQDAALDVAENISVYSVVNSIVDSCEADKVQISIEGNSGDKVARRSYSIGSSNIYGYGVPAY